jgi:hypothetical protein
MTHVPPLDALARTPAKLIEIKKDPIEFTIGNNGSALDIQLANFRRNNPHFNGHIVWQSDINSVHNGRIIKIGTLHLNLPTRNNTILLRTLSSDVNIEIMGDILVEQLGKVCTQTPWNRYLYRKERSCYDGDRFKMSMTLDEPFFTRMLFVKKGTIATPIDQLSFKSPSVSV